MTWLWHTNYEGALTGVATATATTSDTINDTHIIKQRLAFMGDISELCRTALHNISMIKCGATTEASMPFTEALPQLCRMPADDQPRHPCSREQISTALNTMNKECSKELESNEDKVINIYNTWYTLELEQLVMCLRDNNTTTTSGGNRSNNNTDQEYCALRNNSLTSLPQDMSDIDGLKCDACITMSATTMLQWKPPVTPPASIEERTNLAMTMLRQLQSYCSAPSSAHKSLRASNTTNTSSSSSTSTYLHLSKITLQSSLLCYLLSFLTWLSVMFI
jgi:hypothetical protein